MFAWSGWTITQLVAEAGGWTLNTSASEYGNLLHGINGVDSPSDWSWWWELNLWNASNNTWEVSDVGMDDTNGLETPHLAWMPSNGNRSMLPAPNESHVSSVGVQWPNGTHTQEGLERFNAYHITQGTLDGASINSTIEDSSYGHFLSSLADEDAPEDYVVVEPLRMERNGRTVGVLERGHGRFHGAASHRLGSFQRKRLDDSCSNHRILG